MDLLTWIILFSLLGGVLSVGAASAFLLLPEQFLSRLVPPMVGFAVGALLGVVFLDLLPEAITAPGVDAHQVSLTVLAGLLGFFLLEKTVLWRHHHHGDAHACAHASNRAAGTLILIGDGIHNFVDGILIAAAFLTDFQLGVLTSIAVAAHEIPQEMSDFVVLLHSGLSRARALLYNVLSSFTTVAGALLAYFALSAVQPMVPYVLAVAAASFIYIAVADLIPGLHERTQLRASLQQITLIATGVLVIYLSGLALH
ncbi:MAG: ZIP family metal transporter [Gammaproteobacteria bacterium]|nr:MAG: ZIP family metal transporter [Gammaproteobacteria bacterium]